MTGDPAWPAASVITTERLRLEPLRAVHAVEMAPLLDDVGLHTYVGGRPLSVDALRERYARLEVGHSPDSRQGWLNWIVRVRDGGEAAGTVQATLSRGPGLTAALAWVIGSAYQGRGYAKEAAGGMVWWLRREGVAEFDALIHPEHRASIAVARHLGMSATGEVVDGETRWRA